MAADAQRRRRSEGATRAQIEGCIRHRAFRLAYQPIVHLDTGSIEGVEVLCRFDDGASTEGRFQQSERLGLAADLDLAIIETALGDLGGLPEGYVSINLSPSTLLDRRLGDVLLAPGIPGAGIVIEVTEHALITDYEAAEQLLAVIRDSGIRLAVDDAGAGYATFRHILSLRPDIIKMDRSITQDIDADTARRALATALVVFGAEIGATVIAEGVETQDEILALRRAGIHRAQGFALASPAPLPLVPIEYQPAGRAPVEEESPRSRVRRRLRGAVDGLSTAQAEVEDMVALARRAGIPWGEIADIVGMTRQGATKRYGRRGQHER